MKDLNGGNFGLMIAYVLPGMTVLWGVSYASETVQAWLGNTAETGPTVGGFLFVTLAAVGAGLVASTLRWMLVDTLHHWTGIPRPRCGFSGFEQKVAAYEMLGEVHYRYYQFYGNGLVAVTFTFLARRVALGLFSAPLGWADAGFVALTGILAAGSRDTYRKYNERLEMVLGCRRLESDPGMTACPDFPGPSCDNLSSAEMATQDQPDRSRSLSKSR